MNQNIILILGIIPCNVKYILLGIIIIRKITTKSLRENYSYYIIFLCVFLRTLAIRWYNKALNFSQGTSFKAKLSASYNLPFMYLISI